MNPDLPTLPSPSPQGYEHHAPQDTWRPMSGLCLSAFILAIVLAVLAVLTLWVASLLPLVLGVAGLVRVDGARFRGRALAGWAVALALGSGALGYVQTAGLNRTVERLATGVVAAFRAERPEAERDQLLEAWLVNTTGRDEVRERLQARYAAVVQRAGPATGGPVMPGLAGGIFPLTFPPADVEAIGEASGQADLALGGAIFWVRVPFEKGVLHLALVLGEQSLVGLKEPLEKLALSDGPAPVLRDARWFAPKGLLPALPGPGGPEEPAAPARPPGGR